MLLQQLEAFVSSPSGNPHTYYTRQDVADRYGVTVRTVDRWIAVGKLGALKISRKVVRITNEDIAEFDRTTRPEDRTDDGFLGDQPE